MHLTKVLLSGRITHWPSNSRSIKNRRIYRRRRVQAVEDFLRPYRLGAWNKTRWELAVSEGYDALGAAAAAVPTKADE